MRKIVIMPERIMSGENVWDTMGSELAIYGTKALIVTGRHTVKDGTVAKLQELLRTARLSSAVYSGITGETTDGNLIYDANKIV